MVARTDVETFYDLREVSVELPVCPQKPDFNPAPTAVRIHRCGYVSPCRARHCPKRATLIAEKTDAVGRHVRQIELCPHHCDIVIERERSRGLESCDRRKRIASLQLCLRFKGK